jgi:hypothetical protein
MRTMNDEVTIKEAAKAVAVSKGLLAAIIAAFTLMSAVGLAILEWRIDVNVRAELSKLDIGTDAKIVAMDGSIESNRRTGEENAKDIAENKESVREAFRVLMEND